MKMKIVYNGGADPFTDCKLTKGKIYETLENQRHHLDTCFWVINDRGMTWFVLKQFCSVVPPFGNLEVVW